MFLVVIHSQLNTEYSVYCMVDVFYAERTIHLGLEIMNAIRFVSV